MNKSKLSVASYALALAAAALAYAGASQPVLSADSEVAATPDTIARGKYLVTIAGCNDCHTPLKMGENGPEPDYSRMLSGHPESVVVKSAARVPDEPWLVTTTATTTAWSGPWGVSFTANLTPDSETGLGRWTFRNFKDTIRTGRHMGRGRAILPPMPIPMYKHMTDQDLEAVFSYLRTIPAIKNRVPEPLPPQVAANQR
jgi:mono/diheme cytochrome c family protein